MPIARPGEVAIAFETWGEATHPTLVLLHGLGDDRRLWDAMRPHLPAVLHGIAYDLRGHGETASPADPAAYTMAAFVADLECVLDAAGIERALLAGFSLGGAVALHFALAHPARTRAVAAINANAAARDPAEEAALVAAAGSGDAARALRGGAERRWVERLVARLPEGARRAAAVGRTASIVRRADELDLPVWLIASDRDPGFARRSLELLPRLRQGRRLVIEDAGHAAMLDQPEALADALAEFVAAAG